MMYSVHYNCQYINTVYVHNYNYSVPGMFVCVFCKHVGQPQTSVVITYIMRTLNVHYMDTKCTSLAQVLP